MKLHVHVHHDHAELAALLARVTTLEHRVADLAAALKTLTQQETTMKAEMQAQFDAVKADVAAQTTVIDGVKVLIPGLRAQITDLQAKVDAGLSPQETSQALSDIDALLRDNTRGLATAVADVPPVVVDPPVDPPVTDPPVVAPGDGV